MVQPEHSNGEEGSCLVELVIVCPGKVHAPQGVRSKGHFCLLLVRQPYILANCLPHLVLSLYTIYFKVSTSFSALGNFFYLLTGLEFDVLHHTFTSIPPFNKQSARTPANMDNTTEIHDNTSSISHTTSSFSTHPQFKQHPPRQLRRVKTMTQLTRWVSQKISRPSLKNSASGNELSEKNLNDLETITTVVGEQDSPGPEQSTHEKPSLVNNQTKAIETIQEDLEEGESAKHSAPDPETTKEIRLRRSYAAFCEEFTLSGPQQPKRRFEVSMDTKSPENARQSDAVQPAHCPMDTSTALEKPLAIAIQPNSELSQREPSTSSQETPRTSTANTTGSASSPINQETQSKEPKVTMQSTEKQSTSHPRPPPQVLTPSIYRDMQRARQERRRARRQRVWGPLRSLFSRSQSLRGHRVELE